MEQNKKPDLKDLRDQLQAVDEKMLALFADRLKLSEAVYEVKKDLVVPIYDPEQEEKKLKRLEESDDGGIREYGRPFLSSLMRLSRECQYAEARPQSLDWDLGRLIERGKDHHFPVQLVATQGNAYSYSAKAATRLFPGKAYVPHRTFEDAILAVVKGQADAAVLPLENSTAGTVDDVYQLIQSTNLYITEAIRMSVRHRLLVAPGTKAEDIKVIASHKQALSQCSGFIKEHRLKTVEALNTAFAAQDVAESKRSDLAAIATEDAAEAYGLEILDEEISNTKENQTRFVVVRRNLQIDRQADTLALLLRLPHSAGSLVSVMNLFSDYGINLSKIQSIPIPRNPWEYYFYLDCEARPDNAKVLDILYQLQHEAGELRLLGWYRESDLRN